MKTPGELQRHYLSRFCACLMGDYETEKKAENLEAMRRINDTVISARALELKIFLTGKIA